MPIKYKEKEVIEIPKGEPYIPVLQYNASIDNESKDVICAVKLKAVTPDFVYADNAFGNFVYDKNKFSYLINFIKEILLSPGKYRMSDLYPYTYRTMTEIPNRDDKIWDTSELTNMKYMFNGCNATTSLDLSNFNTSNVTNMDAMFNGCNAITSLDLFNFNTSNVTSMNWMFYGCKAITSLDLSNFNTSKVTSMNWMFTDCNAITSLDISNFNTSEVTGMSGMFAKCKAITSLDISNFNTSEVTDMHEMFTECKAITSLDLSNFNTSKVTDMNWMFGGCSNLTTIKGVIDMKSCTIYYNMFKGCPKLTGVKIKNPPADFESITNITSSQYTVVQ